MTSAPYLLGIDAGTSVIKAVLFDASLNAIDSPSQPTTVEMPQPGYDESDMETVWQKAAATIQQLLRNTGVDPSAIVGVGVTGQMVGFWAIDERGQPVRRAILHTDNRTQPLIDHWNREQPGFDAMIFNSSGSAMQPGCTLPLVAWLAEHEPETLHRTATILSSIGWLTYKLTGAAHIDPSQATVLPGDTRARTYNETLFDRMNIRPYRDRFPDVVPATQIIGAVTTEAAHATGLRVGTPVVAGAGDVMATSLGLGAVEPDTAFTILGTTCLNGLVMTQPSPTPEGIGLTFAQPGGRWVRMLFNVLGTPNLDWATRQLYAEAATNPNRFAYLEAEAAHSSPGANGVIFVPYLSPSGTFTPFVEPNARAQFFGLSVNHTRRDMLRAVYEGIAYSIRNAYELFNRPVERILLAGGGSRSAFWCQMIADVTGKTVIVPGETEFGARGAALLAGVGIGWFSTMNDTVPLTDERHFSPRAVPAYNTGYENYLELIHALREVWRNLKTDESHTEDV